MNGKLEPQLSVDALREFAKKFGASFCVLMAYFDEPGFMRYVTWGNDPDDKVSASDLGEEISEWIDSGGSMVMNPATGPAIVHESFKRDAAKNKARLDELEVEAEKLRAFKKYVHDRLDAAGVPVDPESSHKAAGCRIGGRLDELIGERDWLRGVISESLGND